MSKKNQNQNQEVVVEAPDAETPLEEASVPESEQSPSQERDFVCPACKHQSGIKLGLPYQQGEQSFQYVKCTKCSHVISDSVS